MLNVLGSFVGGGSSFDTAAIYVPAAVDAEDS